jgi:hypothetical protein
VTQWSRKTGETSNLFEKFPHMENILNNPQQVPQFLRNYWEQMDPHQQKAYRGLNNLGQNMDWPVAVSGTGTTFLLRFIIFMAMYGDKDKEHPIKILYFDDCYDAANAFAGSLNRLFVDIGKKKAAIRLKDYDMGPADGEDPDEDRYGVHLHFMLEREVTKIRGPIDDEREARLQYLHLHQAVYQYYHNHRDQHSNLRDALNALDNAAVEQETVDAKARAKELIVELYSTFLHKFGGVIVTTPFPGYAAKFARQFEADICFVNDAGKVSESDFSHIIRNHNPALLVAIGNPVPATQSTPSDAPGADSQGVEGQEGSQGTAAMDGAGCAPMWSSSGPVCRDHHGMRCPECCVTDEPVYLHIVKSMVHRQRSR